jgi:hypothetical protein
MTSFLLAFRTPKDYLPGEPDTVAAWRAFFQGIGDHVEELGNPVFERTVIGSPTGETVLGGYSLITADDLDHAAALAEGCPLLALGGAVEIGVITPLAPEQMAAMTGSTAARAASAA